LKAKKDTLSIKHNRLHRDYKNIEEIILKQQKEVEEFKTKVVGGFLDEFLKVKNIYIHPLNLGPYIN